MRNELSKKRIEFGRTVGMVLALAVILGSRPAIAAVSRSTVPVGYSVFQTFPVARTSDGVEGFVQILQDDRITVDLREKMRGMDAAMFCTIDSLNPFCKSIPKSPLRPTVLHLTNRTGRVLDSRGFKRELGQLAVRELYGNSRRTFSVTVDLGSGMGSYAGDVTYFFDLQGQRFHWLTARETTSDKLTEIQVLQSLKTDWKLLPARNHSGQDIVQLACRPKSVANDPKRDIEFELIYTRFAFDGARWVRYELRRPGFWENGHEFPSREEFP